MKTTQIDTDIRNLLKLPPVAWPDAIDALRKKRKAEHMHSLGRAFDDLAERSAFLGEYANRRGSHDQEHKSSLKCAQSRQRKVTRALGYYPAYRRPFLS